jgi:hypothetical protein
VLAALKCASKVAAIYNSEELRAQLEKHIGQVGREVDDIWMPLFAVAAAASQSMDFEENPCFRQLLEAAKRQAAARHAKTADWKSPTPWTANEESEAEMDKIKLVAALRILEWRGGLHPAKLAKDVSMPLNMKVSAQWLSKRLARLGIRAKKERGKRVFSCSPGEVRQALGRLGVEVPAAQASDAGQQGQEGHQQENNDASNAEQPIVENR